MKIYFVTNKKYNIQDFVNFFSDELGMQIASHFTTSELNENNMFMHVLSDNDLNLAFKNNSLFSCIPDYNDPNCFIGITYDEQYNSDVMFMTIPEFNSANIYKDEDNLIIYIDSSTDDMSEYELLESNIFMQSFNKYKHLYFSTNDKNIKDVIKDYLFSDDNKKIKILQNNF